MLLKQYLEANAGKDRIVTRVLKTVLKSLLRGKVHPDFFIKNLPKMQKQEAHLDPFQDLDVLPAIILEAI